MARGQKKRRRRRDKTAIILRLIIVLLIAFIIGLIVWFAMHDRDLRSGVNALKKGQYDKAITCFDASIKKGENVAESYRGKGLALYEQKQYKDAGELLIKSVDKGAEPTAQICNLIALCFMEQEKYEQSIEWFREGLSSSDASDDLVKQMRYQTVICYEKTAQWDEAKESAKSYLSDYPEDDKMAREYKFLETR